MPSFLDTSQVLFSSFFPNYCNEEYLYQSSYLCCGYLQRHTELFIFNYFLLDLNNSTKIFFIFLSPIYVMSKSRFFWGFFSMNAISSAGHLMTLMQFGSGKFLSNAGEKKMKKCRQLFQRKLLY